MKVLLQVALAGLAVGCGGGPADTSDAADLDASEADAMVDARIHEPPAPPRVNGSITIVEAQVLAPAPAPVNTIVAEGIQLGITFTDPTTAIAPVLDTNPGTLFGCKVVEVPVAQLAAAAGEDQGTVRITVDNGGTPANPVFPTCAFLPGGAGYLCPDLTSSQAFDAVNTITLEQVDAQTSRLTVNAGPATFDADDVGRYVKLSGTASAYDATHMTLPIVAITSPTVVVLGAPVPDATVTFGVGRMWTFAGVGPQPGLADPGQLADGASATAILTPGVGDHFPTTTITYGDAGDDFTMDDASADLLRNIPTDGRAFSLSCAACGQSIGTILTITTTDANVVGLSPIAMPLPTTKRVSIRCAEVGQSTITVPALISARLASAGATRIQATFVRGNFGTADPATDELAQVIAGHAMVGFTTP